MAHHRRKEVLERQKSRCNSCGTHQDDLRTRNNKPDVLTIDHIIKKADGGTEKLDNLQALCKACHSKKDNEPRKAMTTSKNLKGGEA